MGEKDHRDAGLGAEIPVDEVDTPNPDGAGRCIPVGPDHLGVAFRSVPVVAARSAVVCALVRVRVIVGSFH